MRFRPVLRRMESDLIQSLAFMFLSNLQQFMMFPEAIIIKDPDGRESQVVVRPEDIQAKAYFIPTGISETLNKEMQVGQLLRFKEVTMNDPTINRAAINRRIAELMGFKNVDELIVKQEVKSGQGVIGPQEQKLIQQRLAEGATPEQIKMEMLGNPPMPMQEEMMGGGQGG